MPNRMQVLNLPGIAPGGMNQETAPEDIPDTQAQTIIDGFLDRPNQIYRRGPVQQFEGLVAEDAATGIVTNINPAGDLIVGLLTKESFQTFDPESNSFAAAANITYNFSFTLSDSAPFFIYNSTPTISGETLISVVDTYDTVSSTDHGNWFWHGGRSDNYTDGTITIIRGSGSVFGTDTAFLANVTPGMYIFAQVYTDTYVTYIGTVKSVDSDTSIQLEKASLYDAAVVPYNTQAFRDVYNKVAKGRLTCSTASDIVTGESTKFQSQFENPALNTVPTEWQIFRERDQAFIGQLDSVTNEITCVLTANAAVDCNEERFFAVDPNYLDGVLDGDNKVQLGLFSAVYANRQWYANISTGASADGIHDKDFNKLWFSEIFDPEAVDTSQNDGDFITIGSATDHNSSIRALMPAHNSLLVFNTSEVWGVFGDSPRTFTVRKVSNNSCLFGMTVLPYQDGVVWAGSDGIYFYDGTNTQNIIADTLNTTYRKIVQGFDTSQYRMYAMLARDQYFLFIESLDPTMDITKSESVNLSQITVCIDLTSGRVNLATNLNLRGQANLPVGTKERVFFLVNNNDAEGTVCNSTDLFDLGGNDSFTCDDNISGPALFIETKSFCFDEPTRKKLFKQLALNYISVNNPLQLISVFSLKNVHQEDSETEFPVTADNVSLEAHRSKLYRRGTHISFRIFE